MKTELTQTRNENHQISLFDGWDFASEPVQITHVIKNVSSETCTIGYYGNFTRLALQIDFVAKIHDTENVGVYKIYNNQTYGFATDLSERVFFQSVTFKHFD